MLFRSVITGLTLPESVSPEQSGTITVTVEDEHGIESVIIFVNGEKLQTLTEEPYTATLTAPDGAAAGDILTITVEATDPAGNTATSTGTVEVVVEGTVIERVAVTGQVLSDITSLPLEGATVQVVENPGNTVQSDAEGRYSLTVAKRAGTYLRITKSLPLLMTTVERELTAGDDAGSDTGIVPVDARLTPLSAAVEITTGGGILSDGNLKLAITSPSGAT